MQFCIYLYAGMEATDDFHPARGASPVTCGSARDLQARGIVFKLRDPEIIIIAVKYVSYNTGKHW